MALNLDKRKIGRKILLFICIAGAMGAVGMFNPISLALNVAQSSLKTKPVSGDIVVVGIDSQSIGKIGRWPWPRDKQAELLQKIDSYNPKAVHLDIGYQGKTTKNADSALRSVIANMKAPISVIALASREGNGEVNTIFSHTDAVGDVNTTTPFAPYHFGYIWELPISLKTERGVLRSPAAEIADFDAKLTNFRINYTYDPRTVPVISAEKILSRSVSHARIHNKTVIIGITDVSQNDVHSMPGWGQRAGVLFQVLGAETLKSGLPLEAGWISFFLVAILVVIAFLTQSGLHHSNRISWTAGIGILAASTWLTLLHIGNDPLPAVALIAACGIYIGRQKAALVRSQRHQTTGFSDMTGYAVEEVLSNSLFVAAVVKRGAASRGYILENDDTQIMKEVGRRLSMIVDERQLTHNEDQQFLWEMPVLSTERLAEHFEGLRRLFSSPIILDQREIDVNIFLGVDRDTSTNIKRRMESALEASKAARDSDIAFKIATTNGFKEQLKIAFLDEFDHAVRNGDIALTFEAQQNLTDGEVGSARISMRWTHPAHGEISSTDLFAHASETGNLQVVSLHLCRQAIEHATRIAAIKPGFILCMKISATVIISNEFEKFIRGSAAHSLANPENIMFEIIDLQAFQYRAETKRAVATIKKLGFKIAIGNFGSDTKDTDLISTFRPDEICMPNSYAMALVGSTLAQIGIDATLRIASAYNIDTMAEDVNDRHLLNELKRRGCMKARGRIISMALNFNDFRMQYLNQESRKIG
ncbi:MAG: EAL domain-containing protein [Sphingorhabdus sp.]